jgi:lysozyme family protein
VNVNDPGFIDGTQLKKCGYVNDPRDPGGETKYGIAKNSHRSINIAALNWEAAKKIYYDEYWVAGKCDKLPGKIAILHMDGCVNNGVKTASIFLQKSLNVPADGAIGNVTLTAANSADQNAVCTSICANRAAYYNKIVQSNPSLGVYLNGWLRRVNEVTMFAKSQ